MRQVTGGGPIIKAPTRRRRCGISNISLLPGLSNPISELRASKVLSKAEKHTLCGDKGYTGELVLVEKSCPEICQIAKDVTSAGKYSAADPGGRIGKVSFQLHDYLLK